VLLGERQDYLLVLQVHGPGGRSDKALRGGKRDVPGPRRLDARLDRAAGNPVALTEYDYLLVIEQLPITSS
jgi:hypothetical protein